MRKVDWFDQYEMDSWSPIWPEDFSYELHCSKNLALKVYWLLLGKDLLDMLRIVSLDTYT